MPTQDRYIAGVPCWTDSIRPDVDAAVAFYSGLLGWEFEDVMPAGSPTRYLIARIDGEDVAAIGSAPDGAAADPSWNTYVWVDDADATAARVYEAGGTVLQEPVDVGDAGRMATFADPEGATFCVWQPGSHRGAQRVNAHGSLNFNDLHSRDLDAAAAFYGAVFGWDRVPLGPGAVWALPAYGDFLEERDPGLRARMKEMGAPPRFEEVVASLSAVEPDASPHWSITLAVDDADAIAKRVPELGGRVLVPPFDAPWVRMTVVADPGGATFVASTFVPENKDLVPAGEGAGAAA